MNYSTFPYWLLRVGNPLASLSVFWRFFLILSYYCFQLLPELSSTRLNCVKNFQVVHNLKHNPVSQKFCCANFFLIIWKTFSTVFINVLKSKLIIPYRGSSAISVKLALALLNTSVIPNFVKNGFILASNSILNLGSVSWIFLLTERQSQIYYFSLEF